MPFRKLLTGSAVFTGTVLLAWSPAAYALTIKVTDPNATYHAQADDCPPSYPQCYDDAYLQTAPLNARTAGLGAAFAEFNAAQKIAGNPQWSIVDGGFLDATFLVDTFQTIIDPSKTIGGVKIDIQFIYTGADRGDFSWAQGLLDNYTPGPGGHLVPPHFKMDTNAAGCDDAVLLKKCPPLYPFQYADGSFYDFPEGFFPNGFFNGYAYPVKIDSNAHTMKVYQGVGYGFQLSIPEPATWLLMLVGMCLICFSRYNRRQRT